MRPIAMASARKMCIRDRLRRVQTVASVSVVVVDRNRHSADLIRVYDVDLGRRAGNVHFVADKLNFGRVHAGHVLHLRGACLLYTSSRTACGIANFRSS